MAKEIENYIHVEVAGIDCGEKEKPGGKLSPPMNARN